MTYYGLGFSFLNTKFGINYAITIISKYEYTKIKIINKFFK